MATSAPTVVVVEDEAPIRDLIAEVLRSEGYAVAEATDGVQALHLLDKHAPEHPCLVLLDMMLPHLDGQDVLKHLARRQVDVPVVAMSANHQLLTTAVRAGAQATLPKPFDLGGLLELVERYCSTPP